jgi:hypothetical protein
LLGDVRELLAPGGIAVIGTTHFGEERFGAEADAAPQDRGDFDRYAEASAAQDKGIPVRMFSKDSLLREIERAGLEAVVWRPFSYVRPESLDRVAAMYGVTVDQVRDVGLSQYAVVRPSGRGAPAAR